MRPDIAVDDPLRTATRKECYMHEWMLEASRANVPEVVEMLRKGLRASEARRRELR